MGAHPIEHRRQSRCSGRLAGSVLMAAVTLGACAANPVISGTSAVAPSTAAQSPRSMSSPQASPSLPAGASWSSITWTASDPAPFSGPGNQYVFAGVPWAGGTVLVGEEAPLPSGNVEGVVWTSPDNAHWQRIPNTSGTFSGSEIEAVAASGSTLVAVGDSRLEDSATTLTPPVGIAWTSPDGTHWQRVADEAGSSATSCFTPWSPARLASSRSATTSADRVALAFSTDGVHWRREDAEAVFADSRCQPGSRGPAATSPPSAVTTWRTQSGVISQTPGNAAAWWSSNGQDWQAEHHRVNRLCARVRPTVDRLAAGQRTFPRAPAVFQRRRSGDRAMTAGPGVSCHCRRPPTTRGWRA